MNHLKPTMSLIIEFFKEKQDGLLGLIEYSYHHIPYNITDKFIIRINTYHRYICRLNKLMDMTILSNNILEVSNLYWKILDEFKCWIISFSKFQFFRYFKIILSSMFIILFNHIIITFPELEWSITSRYPSFKQMVY